MPATYLWVALACNSPQQQHCDTVPEMHDTNRVPMCGRTLYALSLLQECLGGDGEVFTSYYVHDHLS